MQWFETDSQVISQHVPSLNRCATPASDSAVGQRKKRHYAVFWHIEVIICRITEKRGKAENPIKSRQKRKIIIGMANFYCKWCGRKYTSVSSLVAGTCSYNPEGKKHELYEGSEKSQYTCKFCGRKYSSLTSLTAGSCSESPTRKHQPAL